jgi:transposase
MKPYTHKFGMPIAEFREMLREMTVKKKLCAREIGDRFGVGIDHIAYWIRKFGLPRNRDPRAHYPRPWMQGKHKTKKESPRQYRLRFNR